MEPEKPRMRLDQRAASNTNLNRVGLSAQQSAGLEFDSVEDMLRHDRDATYVPDSVAARLNASIEQLPPPKPWWKRLFSRS